MVHHEDRPCDVLEDMCGSVSSGMTSLIVPRKFEVFSGLTFATLLLFCSILL